MAALAMTPKLLGRISNENYQEKGNWEIDDIALGPANELLISGHNLEKPEAFISMYKEDSGKYDNRPEISRSFRQPQSSEQLVLFLEGSSIIGLKAENALRLFTTEGMGDFKTMWWNRSPTCVCFYRGKLYAASSSSTIVSVCNLDSEEKSDIFLSDMGNDCVLEIVVVMEMIYVCTKFAGRALVFSMTGSKKLEFENPVQTDAMATSICINERRELVFVLWNNIQIQLYSQKTSRCLYAFDMTEELHKIRVTSENILVTLSASKCIVSVYDLGEAIKFGESQHTILSSVKKKHQKKLMSPDVENLECHSANSETLTNISSPWKSASKQSTDENLRRKYYKDSQKSYKRIEEPEIWSKKTGSEQKNWKYSLLEDIEVENLQHEIKQLGKERESLHRQHQQLNNYCIEQFSPLNERINEADGTCNEVERRPKVSKDNLDVEKEKSTLEERSPIQINERTKELESMLKELESRQEKLKYNLVQEERNALRELHTRILAEIELETIKRERRRGIVSSKKEVKDNYYTKLRLCQTENARKTLEQSKAMLEKDKEYLTKLLAAEERNETELKKSLEKIHSSQKELEHKNLKLQEEKEYLNDLLSTRKREAISQGMLSRFLSDAEPDNLTSQKDTAINCMDELESVIAESVDTGIYSSNSTSTSHIANPLLANGELLNPDLKVAVTLTVKGAHMHIPDTGVELDIPTGAVRRKRLIEMTIIPFGKQFAPIENFSSNSSAVVELLPNNAIFYLPVRLKLPHCLQLKNDYKDSKNPVKVFVSHHEAGPPFWEEDSSAKCTLEGDHCIILLKKFCWVKYEINDKVVVAKRLKVFTAGKILHPNDSIAEIEVGYHMDLPGRAENMTASLGMEFCQNKPFVFVKDGELSLQLVLSKIVPNEWTYVTPDDNPKIISYKSVADDKDTSCPFALEKSSSSERKPYCIFKIVQGNESVELSMRF